MPESVPVEVTNVNPQREREKIYEFSSAPVVSKERWTVTRLERQIQNFDRQIEIATENKQKLQVKLDAINALET